LKVLIAITSRTIIGHSIKEIWRLVLPIFSLKNKMMKQTKTMALVSLWGHSLFIILVVLQHFLRTDLDMRTHFISEYAVGYYGWIQTLAFFILAIAGLCLMAGLFANLKASIISVVTLSFWCIGVLLIAFFPADLPEVIPTRTGNIHVFAAQFAFINLAATMIFLGFNFKQNNNWKALSPLSWFYGTMSILILIALVLMPISFKGLIQRTLFLWDLSWLMFVSQQLYFKLLSIPKVVFVLPFLPFLTFFTCTAMKNPDKPEMIDKPESSFYTTRDGYKLFIYNYQPIEHYKATIFIISGITGLNHHNEKDIIELLANNENRVVVIHPRGTGYSDGKRGDISNFKDFIQDFSEIIMNDKDYGSTQHKVFLFGHSMSTAILLAAAEHLTNIAGAILINPPYIQKKAKGMSPSIGEYIKYASYSVFAKHKPIVNMAGDPSKIENEEDRRDSETKANDTLLIKYFSMYYMMEARNLINSTLDYCKKADYPLLLIYGMKDNIADKTGCDLMYNQWKQENKEYKLIENGSHGKSTVMLAKDIINNWIKSQ
jgi:alpha-beta hydrolase superfamily lysophospholipase